MSTQFAAEPCYWRVMCQTHHHPGQWQAWYRQQCCAVGWNPPVWGELKGEGWCFDATIPPRDMAWARARSALRKMRPGDNVVVMLPGGRVARAGEVVRVEAGDGQWNPIVQPVRDRPFGDNGRRIQVRWDLQLGPGDAGIVVRLPVGLRHHGQDSITQLRPETFAAIREAMNDRLNWVGLHGSFGLEEALSDYIAMHPHQLEDGMTVHAWAPKIREWAITPAMRIDVILMDREQRTVVVECKQGSPVDAHVDQLCDYVAQLGLIYPEWAPIRGLLVHGGSRQVAPAVKEYARQRQVSLVHHDLRVDFFTTV